MITVPWVTRGRSVDAPVTVMASRFQLTSRRHVPAFLLASLGSYVQALRAPGVVGVSLRAAPWRGAFWTLSSWRSPGDLRTYARTEPHLSTMRRLRPVMANAVFVTWDADRPPTWSEAEERVRQSEVGPAPEPSAD